MLPRIVRAAGVVWLHLALVPGAGAQGTISLQFRPTPGRFVHTIYQMNADLVFVGLPAIPDSTPGEVTALVSETQRVLARNDSTVVLQLVYDSVRARHRVSGDVWEDFAFGRTPAGPLEMFADPSLATTPRALPPDTLRFRMMQGLAGELFIGLPTESLEPGGLWGTEATFPYTVALPDDSTVLMSAVLSGNAIGTLDSLVLRATDSLAYVTVRGELRPHVQPSPFRFDERPTVAEVWGTFASTLIWSTGWNTFVSGATRARIHTRVEAPAGSGVPDARVTANVTARFRIRP